MSLVSFDPPALVADVRGTRVELEVPFTGEHHALNTLAALGAYAALGLPLERAGEGAPAIAFSRLRGEELELPDGALLINDAWNANPVSMRAALAYLVRRAEGAARVAVLGPMAELGPDAPRYHSEIGEAAREAGVDVADRGRRRACASATAARRSRRRRRPPRCFATCSAPGDVVLVKASRVHRLERGRGSARGSARGVMERILIAAIVALVVSIAVGPKFIEFLRRKELGQFIREEGPAGHAVKAGTPTAGGVLILVAATLAFLAFSRYSTAGLTVLFATVACGAIGFLDDYIKLTHQRSLGLPGRWKLILLVGVAAAVGYLAHRTGLSTDVYLPLAQRHARLQLGVVRPRLLRHRRRGERREPRRRHRRPRRRHRPDRVLHLHGDQRLHVHPERPAGVRRAEHPAPRHGDRRRRADRGHDRLPLVQRLPRRDPDGRHRLVRDRRSARRLRDHAQGRGAAAADRRDLRDRGALGDAPGLHASSTWAAAASS